MAGSGVVAKRRAVLLLTLTLGACGGRLDGPRPEASLAATLEAQAAFRVLYARWLERASAPEDALTRRMTHFVRTYPKDPNGRFVRLLLARLAMERGQLEQARVWVASALPGPDGNTEDFSRVLQAALETRAGRPSAALARLIPLRGKLVDGALTLLFAEEYLQAARGAEDWPRVHQAMLDWLLAAPPEAREEVERALTGLIGQLPLEALEGQLPSLEALSADEAHSETQRAAAYWLSFEITERLVTEALARPSPALAARLLSAGPARVRVGETGTALRHVAEQRAASARIIGRRVGLVITTRDERSRRRSAAVAAGLSRSLGLPAMDGQAPPLELVVRADDGSASGVARALSELTSDGAALLVAGVEPALASAALDFAARERVPVLTLSAPAAAPPESRFGFELGAPLDDVGALEAWAEREAGGPVLRLDGAAACAEAPGTAPARRLTIAPWRRQEPRSLLLVTDADCARRAVDAAQAARWAPLLGLGLESAELLDELRWSAPHAALGAGRFPARRAEEPTELQAWRRRYGAPPSWFQALGHDAGQLCAAAAQALPRATVEAPRQVTELHARAAALLRDARVQLWTTHHAGFSGAQRLPRTLELRTP